ncbi:hypothetical protein [Rhodoluna sp.]|jgi:hypothetical protein|nr:hypothetical protein [Rhodoluna sp.]
MSQELETQVTDEVSRITALPLEAQPPAFAALRDQLEQALNSDDNGAEA